MFELMVPLIPLAPFLAAALLGAGHAGGWIQGEASERFTMRVAVVAAALSALFAGLLLAFFLHGDLPGDFNYGDWLSSGAYRVPVSFSTDTLSLSLSLLFALISLLTLRFSFNYLHREPGYHRFFIVMSLFVGAMQLLVTAGNMVFAFIGWELAGVSSYLLIAYAYDRPVASGNATRAFVTNRIGDAGFVLAIFLAFGALGGVDWQLLQAGAGGLGGIEAGLIAGCFLLAAITKSGQVPMTPWITRALEGPTPSSAIFYGAVMVHAGVYLVLRLEPVFEQAPAIMHLMAGFGFVTAAYSIVCGWTQSDVKSALIFATAGQVGLMFLACGLGFWTLAAWHLAAHALFRAFQFLTAPSLMHQIDRPTRSVPRPLRSLRWLHTASLQRFWLDPLGDWAVAGPVSRMARDANVLDREVTRFVGLPAPAVRALSSLAEWEERKLGYADLLEAEHDVARGMGIAGKVMQAFAAAFNWFEVRVVLGGAGPGIVHFGRRSSRFLLNLERFLARPRYLVFIAVATAIALL